MNEVEYHEKRATFSQESSYEKIRRLYDFEHGAKLKILDVGCGNGKLDDFLVKLGHEVTGIDINPTVDKESFFRNIKQDLNFDWKVHHQYFDMVVCMDVAEHLYDQEHLFNQVNLALKEDGIFLLGVPNHFDLRQRFRMFLGKGIVHWDNLKHKEKAWNFSHIRFFALSELLEMFDIFDLRVEKMQFNFMGAGIVPVRFSPEFFRKFLLRCWPGLFSGKFIFSLKRANIGNSEEKPRKILIPFTPKNI